MCQFAYLGSDRALHEITWSDERPAFYVKSLVSGEEEAEVEEVIRNKLKRDNIYYLGSHEGCGCGFQTNIVPEFRDEDFPKKLNSLKSLASFLREAQTGGAKLQIFSFWHGNHASPSCGHRSLSPAAFEVEGFEFAECETVDLVQER